MLKIISLLLLVLSDYFQVVLSDELVYRTPGPLSFIMAKKVHDDDKRTPDFIEAMGYIAETHEIKTEDDYILTLHRIPKGKKEIGDVGLKPVVIFGHGLFAASDTWLLAGRKSFPYVLAEAGYDVWLPNLRGNLYSYKHVRLSSQDRQYWDYGFHETAVYDLAAVIDHVIKKTGVEKVFYIGHSRGTAIGYILCADKPEYNNKIHFMVSLSPVVYLKHSRSPVLRIITDLVSSSQLSVLSWIVTFTGFSPLELTNLKILPTLCNLGSFFQSICLHGFSLLNGYSEDNLNKEQLGKYLFHFPMNVSEREITHYLQIARTDKFENFDFGRIQNLIRYGSLMPPLYDLSKITVPIVFYYGTNDFMNSLEDVIHLTSQIKNNRGVYKIKTYNHLDYLWGKNANETIYQHAIRLMNEYREKKIEFVEEDAASSPDNVDAVVSVENGSDDKPKFEGNYVEGDDQHEAENKAKEEGMVVTIAEEKFKPVIIVPKTVEEGTMKMT